jgi:hypothetical protein
MRCNGLIQEVIPASRRAGQRSPMLRRMASKVGSATFSVERSADWRETAAGLGCTPHEVSRMREFGVVLGGLGLIGLGLGLYALIRPIPRLGLGRRARCADAFADRGRAFDALGAAASAKVCAEAYRTAALNAGVTLD